jgi:hypothetical protein
MTSYLEKEFDWSGLRLCGLIRRSRKPIGATEWTERETHTWLSSLSAERVTPNDIAKALRGHWVIENGIFQVRDVSYGEDHFHGRKIARGLSSFRDVAINIIRHAGYPFVPDGWRDIASHPGMGIDMLRHMRLIL